MEFKNLAEVTQLEEVPEGASVLAATAEGEVVRVPGAGLGGGGADWNAAEGQPGYIANKPFGVVTVLGNHSYTVPAGEDVLLEGFPEFRVGETVTITVDGTDYSLVAFYNDGVIIGEPYDELGDNEGLEWQAYVYESAVWFSSKSEHEVSYTVTSVTKVPNNLMPDSVLQSIFPKYAKPCINAQDVLRNYIGTYAGFADEGREPETIQLDEGKWESFEADIFAMYNTCMLVDDGGSPVYVGYTDGKLCLDRSCVSVRYDGRGLIAGMCMEYGTIKLAYDADSSTVTVSVEIFATGMYS